MTADSVIRARLPGQLKARLIRIAIAKQSHPRAAATCLREAVVEKVAKEEHALQLRPITKKEIRELLKEGQ